MSTFAWCREGRHQDTKPKYSKPCPGTVGDRTCDCTCHKKPKFARRKTK